MKNDAAERADADKDDRVDAGQLPDRKRQDEEKRDGRQIEHRAQTAQPGPQLGVEQRGRKDLEQRAEDQAGRRGPQAVEAVLHESGVLEAVERPRDQNDDDDRGQHQRPGSDQRAGDACGLKACIGRGIDAHRAGGGFGHRDHVEQILRREPRVFERDVLEEGDGRQTAADREQAGLEKLPEKL